MLIILFAFTFLFFFGAYMIMVDLLKFPNIKASRAVLRISRREKKKLFQALSLTQKTLLYISVIGN
ncbi:hypothetical protein [Clostridium sp.]|jgi:hypothetical protein|uniref:hypothetical protein n=1 Tax=Clostridium sp. TaxID=1506 RepID=UPI0025908B6E|nr:hypothetical protein [Clostridium sp.]